MDYVLRGVVCDACGSPDQISGRPHDGGNAMWQCTGCEAMNRLPEHVQPSGGSIVIDTGEVVFIEGDVGTGTTK